MYLGGGCEGRSAEGFPRLGYEVQYSTLQKSYLSDIIDSISRASSVARLMRSQNHEHARTTDEQRSLLGFVIATLFGPAEYGTVWE